MEDEYNNELRWYIELEGGPIFRYGIELLFNVVISYITHYIFSMPVKYNEQYNQTVVSKDNFKQITGYSLVQLYEFIGVNAISEEKQLVQITGIYPQVTLRITISELGIEITRTFLFHEFRIHNDAFDICNSKYGASFQKV